MVECPCVMHTVSVQFVFCCVELHAHYVSVDYYTPRRHLFCAEHLTPGMSRTHQLLSLRNSACTVGRPSLYSYRGYRCSRCRKKKITMIASIIMSPITLIIMLAAALVMRIMPQNSYKNSCPPCGINYKLTKPSLDCQEIFSHASELSQL